MTDKLLHGFRVLTCVKHISHNGMPEIVQPHTLQTHFLRRLLEVMGTQIRRQHLPGDGSLTYFATDWLVNMDLFVMFLQLQQFRLQHFR